MHASTKLGERAQAGSAGLWRWVIFLVILASGGSVDLRARETRTTPWASRTEPAHRSSIRQASAEQETGRVRTIADVMEGSLLFRREEGDFEKAPSVETDVDIRVNGMIGRTRVVQRFRNPSDRWQEGIYVFPLPERAAVDSLQMKIGERILEGAIRERTAAKASYERAKREGKKTSLLEQERPNVFTMSVANIGPGESIEVALEYQEDIRYDRGRFELRFPMVVAPRYIPGSGQREGEASKAGWTRPTSVVADAARITPPLRPPGASGSPVRMRVELRVGMNLTRIESPSHAIDVAPGAGYQYRVSLLSKTTPAERDFVLRWEPDADEAPQAALFSETIDGAHYALVMLLPPSATGRAQRLPRETVFVIDTSGSMAGESIEQARLALIEGLGRLSREDRFNIVAFDDTASSLFDAPVAATPSNIERASRYVHRLRSNGGTEMLEALRLAFSQRTDAEGSALEASADALVRQVVFITDGSVGNERQLFRYIHDHLRERRLFTVGIGSAPNAYFMTRAARFGRGSFTYIGQASEVAEKMGTLFHKISMPVLSDIDVDFDDPSVAIWPRRLPDLYAGEPVVVTARLNGAPDHVDITGRLAGRPWQGRLELSDGAPRNGIAKLWARRQILSLMDSLAEGADPDGVQHSVTALALEHHLVSKYTSLVAVEKRPSAPAGAALRRPIPTMLPAGWHYEPVVGSLPQGGTPAGLMVLLGFVAMILGVFIHWNRDRSCHEKRSVFS